MERASVTRMATAKLHEWIHATRGMGRLRLGHDETVWLQKTQHRIDAG